jgi:hypothetical protein
LLDIHVDVDVGLLVLLRRLILLRRLPFPLLPLGAAAFTPLFALLQFLLRQTRIGLSRSRLARSGLLTLAFALGATAFAAFTTLLQLLRRELGRGLLGRGFGRLGWLGRRRWGGRCRSLLLAFALGAPALAAFAPLLKLLLGQLRSGLARRLLGRSSVLPLLFRWSLGRRRGRGRGSFLLLTLAFRAGTGAALAALLQLLFGQFGSGLLLCRSRRFRRGSRLGGSCGRGILLLLTTNAGASLLASLALLLGFGSGLLGGRGFLLLLLTTNAGASLLPGLALLLGFGSGLFGGRGFLLLLLTTDAGASLLPGLALLLGFGGGLLGGRGFLLLLLIADAGASLLAGLALLLGFGGGLFGGRGFLLLLTPDAGTPLLAGLAPLSLCWSAILALGAGRFRLGKHEAGGARGFGRECRPSDRQGPDRQRSDRQRKDKTRKK